MNTVRSLIRYGANGDALPELVKRWTGVLLVTALAFWSAADVRAAEKISVASGNWNAAATWNNSTVPALDDNVVIDTSHSVTVSASVAISPASITINTGGLLEVRNTLTVNGPTTVSGTLLHSSTTGAKTFNGDVTIHSGGIWTNTVVEAMAYGADVTINAGGAMTESGNAAIACAGSFRNDGIYNPSTGVHTFSGTSKTFSGVIVIPAVSVTGTYTNNGELTGSTTFIGVGGTLTQGQNAILTIGGTLTVATLDASASGNTVSYTKADIQTVKPATYQNLTLSGTSAKTMTSVTVNGILSMEGTATASLAPTYGANAALQYNTAASRTAGVEWITPFAGTGGVIITNSGTITLNAAKVLNASVPLAIRSGATLNSGNFKLTLGGAFTNSGTFTVGTSTVEWNGPAAQSIAPGAYYNVIFSGGGVKSIGPGTTFSGYLSIAPSGNSKVSVAAGLNLNVNSLTLGGVGQAGGTWGSSSSIATHKNDTFFDLTTGYLTVARTIVYHVVPVNPLAASPFDAWTNAATDIQTAVNKASADLATAGAQCVVLVSNGIYTVTNEITITNGIALRSVSTNWNDTTIKGGYPAASNRCISITGAGAVVDGFTITNGYVLGISGGGISMTSASTVQNCLIVGNTTVSSSAGRGGGICASDGSIIHCTVKNNTSLPSGGGGGIYMLYVAGGNVVVSNCIVTGNRATTSSGGGINATGGLVVNCVISNNVAATFGGGVHKGSSGAATSRNCLIVGNQAASGGGVGMTGSAGMGLENCTIVGNLATNGGGVYIENAVPMQNCIVTSNKASLVSGTNNIAADPAIFSYSCSPDLISGGVSNITTDPMFVIAGNGFGTNCVGGDYRLKAGSPCIDTGTNLSWMASAVDLLGDARVQGSGPNMGAYETWVSVLRGTVIMMR